MSVLMIASMAKDALVGIAKGGETGRNRGAEALAIINQYKASQAPISTIPSISPPQQLSQRQASNLVADRVTGQGTVLPDVNVYNTRSASKDSKPQFPIVLVALLGLFLILKR